MKITEMLGTPVSDPADPIPPVTRGCQPPSLPPEPEPEPLGVRSRAWLGAIVIVASLAVGYGMAAVVQPAAAEPPQNVPTEQQSAVVAPAVSAVAEMATALHLTGLAGREDLATLFTGTIPATAPTGLWVNRAAAIAVEPHSDSEWLVTVAVDLLEMIDGAYEPAGIQFFEIRVACGDSPAATSLPSRVPAPPIGAQLGAGQFPNPVPADQEHAIAGFLGAHLTGNGEVARFAAATARIPVFPEPPYKEVSMLRLGADSQGVVRSQVAATTRSGTEIVLEYTLELTFERGVWEIAAINRVP